MAEIRKVGIVGLGTMGNGIAQVCLAAGLPIVARELTDELAARGRGAIERRFDRAVERGRMTSAERDDALGLLELTVDLDAFAECDLVIETVIEDLGLKREVFAELERIVSDDTLLATNTSSLSVTDIAVAVGRPTRVVGIHFFNPAPVLPLVEVVRAVHSSEAALESAWDFALRVGKDPIRCADTPGFVVNRILIPILNDAVRVLDEGAASPEDIDKGMCLGASWPMGPLALIDLIGLDVMIHVGESLWQAYREPRFAPPPRLVRMAKAGLLGRKTGMGFYDYQGAGE
jgi:3-hydroxybutyryl-CoA dehydrogenase